jgi:hypothetical protein
MLGFGPIMAVSKVKVGIQFILLGWLATGGVVIGDPGQPVTEPLVF